jgi:flagellar biosynthesis component FlhA
MFNLGEDNRCNISFGLKTVPNVPVFLTIFISFFLGLLCALPLSLMKNKNTKKSPKPDKDAKIKSETDSGEKPVHVVPDEKIKQEAAEAKKRFLDKRKGK